MKKRGRKEKAFSLVELLISLAIFAIIGVSLYAAFSRQSRSQILQKDFARLQQEMRNLTDRLTREFKQFVILHPKGSSTKPIDKLFMYIHGCRFNDSGSLDFDHPFLPDPGTSRDCIRFISIDESKSGGELVKDYSSTTNGHTLKVKSSDCSSGNIKKNKFYIITDGNNIDPVFVQNISAGFGSCIVTFDDSHFFNNKGLEADYPAGSKLYPVRVQDYSIDINFCIHSTGGTCDKTAPTLVVGEPSALLTSPPKDYIRPLVRGVDEFLLTFNTLFRPSTPSPSSDYPFLRGITFEIKAETLVKKKDKNGNPLPLTTSIKRRVKFTSFRSSKF